MTHDSPDSTVPESLTLPSERDASGRSLGKEELELLREVVDSGCLFSVPGTMVPKFERELEQVFGVAHARAVSSGSAAVHTALGALDIEPGDEVITTGITDMGAIAPILFQGALPVFADVDPDTLNVTADTICDRITDRTKLIIVTHLFGNPCDMDPILALARSKGIPVLEDAAQAYLAEYRGQITGSIGDIATYSMHQVKHMTSGEGGFVLTSSPELARRARVWADKGWNYSPSAPDHEFLGLNYRMSELQGAVALAQLRKLRTMVSRRVESARMLAELLESVPGISPPAVTPGATHTYWRFPVRIDRDELGVGPDEIGAALHSVNVWAKPGYIRRPAFMCAQFRDRRTFGASWFPYSHFWPDRPLEDPEEYPGSLEGLARILVLPWTERHNEDHARYLHGRIADAVDSARSKVYAGGVR